MRMKRMWINQPSTLQLAHKFHGMNVLAPEESSDNCVTVYPIDGPVISLMVPTMVLSEGWTAS